MAYFLGIDGGGTKTACVVGDELRVLGSASTGGCSIVRLGEEVARQNLHEAIRQACEQARIVPAQVTSVCLGAAGVSAAGVREKLAKMIGELVSGHIAVLGDMDIALEAAFGDGPGVIVIAGTGSIAFGRNKDGKTMRVGGWGYAISDEGSGHWIGRELVRRALHAWDTDDPTDLPVILQAAWKVDSAEEVVRLANACPAPNFADLVPQLVNSATQGDVGARGILEDAAVELTHLASEAIARLWGQDARMVPMAVSGSIFACSEVVRETVLRIMRDRGSAWVLPGIVDPVTGALAQARKAVVTS